MYMYNMLMLFHSVVIIIACFGGRVYSICFSLQNAAAAFVIHQREHQILSSCFNSSILFRLHFEPSRIFLP